MAVKADSVDGVHGDGDGTKTGAKGDRGELVSRIGALGRVAGDPLGFAFRDKPATVRRTDSATRSATSVRVSTVFGWLSGIAGVR